MNNYQLYRTNVLLGGQMKYDLILNSSGNNANIIDDIHITPISDHSPYNKYVKENILNYSHQENIKNFYKNSSGYFYKDFINPLLNNPYPLPDNYKGKNYDSTYEMGCRRKNYQLYGKQFEFFCPIWLEQISNLNQLKFEIQIKTSLDKSDDNLLISKIIQFSQDGEVSKLEKYFNDYIKFIKLDSGKDWIFDVNKMCSIVSGLNVETGTNVNIELNHFYRDLVYRERPLLEFNNMIISELNKNKLIVPQLFNFNICFNLEDILSEFVISQLSNSPMYININVILGDKILECRDIFSNYEYIPKKILISGSYSQEINRNNELEKFNIIDIIKDDNNFNVLDYLNDNKCIDLIDKNKIIQNICHWCNSIEPTYHFNVYDGFSLMFKNNTTEKDTYINIPYYSENITNLTIDTQNQQSVYCYPYWCNNYIISFNNLKKLTFEIINDFYNHDYLFSKFSSNCVVKNINYKTSDDIEPIDVVLLQLNLNEIGSFYNINSINDLIGEYNGIDWKYFYINSTIDDEEKQLYKILYNSVRRKIILITQYSNKKYLTYKNILSALSPQVSLEQPIILNELYKILSSPNSSGLDLIKFSNGLVTKKTNSPSISSQEIEYYKSSSNKSIVRLMGKIKPYFIKIDDRYKNYQYYKIKYKDTPSEYKIYSQTIYEPKYPSISYNSLKYNDLKYNIDENEPIILELHHYSINKIVYLKSNIDYEKIINTTDNILIEDLVKECIEKQYGKLLKKFNNDIYNDNLSYIINKYDVTRSSIEMVDSQPIYKIQIRLK